MANLPKSIYYIFFLILIIAVPNTTYSQNGLFLIGGNELSLSDATYNYRFQKGGHILKRGIKSGAGTTVLGQVGWNAKLHYRFANNFGLEAGLLLTEINFCVYDSAFIKNNNITNTGLKFINNRGSFNVVKYYLAPQLTAYYYFNIKSPNVHPYLSGGIGFNFLASRHSTKYSSFLYNPTGENLVLTTNYLSYYPNLFTEAGISICNKAQHGGDLCYFVGLKYYYAGNMISGDYQNMQNGTVVYSDHVTASGSYLCLVLRLGGALINTHKNRKNNKHENLNEQKTLPPPNLRTEIKDSLKLIKPVLHSSDSIPKEMTGRMIEVHKIIKVKSQHITLKVWDHESIDGDELSLNLNGNWILQDYVLQKQQKIMKHDLIQGVNYLLLYAQNEGRYKPCTSAILIEDGFSSQLVILNSSFEISQTVQINVVK